jgi:hypothetical protein
MEKEEPRGERNEGKAEKRRSLIRAAEGPWG